MQFQILLFLLTIVLRCWNPFEYILKIIISFFTVLFDEMSYGVRHVKLFKIQKQRLASVLQDRFFKKFAKLTEIYPCQSLFIITLQNFMSIFPYRTIMDDCFWKWKTFFLSKFMIKSILDFNKLFFQTQNMYNGWNDTNIEKQIFLKKLRRCFRKK